MFTLKLKVTCSTVACNKTAEFKFDLTSFKVNPETWKIDTPCFDWESGWTNESYFGYGSGSEDREYCPTCSQKRKEDKARVKRESKWILLNLLS
jgi:hypothetical protein